MADPLVQKISMIPAQTEAVQAADELIMNDVSETTLTNYTKRTRMDAIKLFNSAQIADGIVIDSHIPAGVINISKIKTMTSTEFAARVSDETGSGKLVFGTSPTLITPVLGTPASGTLTNCTGLPSTGLTSGAVTAGKIASGGVSASNQFAAQVVDTAAIKDGSVTRGKLAVMDRPIAVPITGMDETVLATSKAYVPIPTAYNGYTLVSAMLTIDTKSTSLITVNIKNDSGSIGNITLNANASNSSTVALNHALVTNEHLIFTITSTANDGKGLFIVLNITG